METLKSVIIFLTLIGFIFGGYFHMEKTYAKDKEVKRDIKEVVIYAQLTNKQLGIKIETDILTNKQQRYNMYMDRYGSAGERAPDPMIKERMVEMQHEIAAQDKKVKEIEATPIGGSK